MRLPLRPALLAGLAVLLAGPAVAQSSAQAAASADARFRGSYARDDAASDPMEKIVDDGMARLGRVYRVWPISGQAKKRLRETNEPHAWVVIDPRGDRVTVESPRYKLDTPRNGVLPRWEREPGDFVDVTTNLQADRLEQRFVAEDGERLNVYTLSADGRTLYLDVTVTSPKLDRPLTYRQVYRRHRG